MGPGWAPIRAVAGVVGRRTSPIATTSRWRCSAGSSGPQRSGRPCSRSGASSTDTRPKRCCSPLCSSPRPRPSRGSSSACGATRTARTRRPESKGSMHRLLSFVLVVFVLEHAIAAQDWPQWRGPARDGSVPAASAPTAWPNAFSPAWQRRRRRGLLVTRGGRRPDLRPQPAGSQRSRHGDRCRDGQDALAAQLRRGVREEQLCVEDGEGPPCHAARRWRAPLHARRHRQAHGVGGRDRSLSLGQGLRTRSSTRRSSSAGPPRRRSSSADG